MKPKLLADLRERSQGFCEVCGHNGSKFSIESDHFFGRKNAPETFQNLWRICSRCHLAKTTNDPSAAHWLTLFITHCDSFGFTEARELAVKKLEWTMAKGVAA